MELDRNPQARRMELGRRAGGGGWTLDQGRRGADVRRRALPIRSYVLQESGGSVGTVCIYEAVGPDAIRRHASLAHLPVDEIVPIADTVVVRPDPAPTGV